MDILRLANVIQMKSENLDKIWSVVRNLKYNPEAEGFLCADNGLYKDKNIITDQVTEIEQKLNIQSSNQRYENMTAKSLEHAAEMLIYLAVCPGSFSPWLKFYSKTYRYSIFNLQFAPQEIMLTLNRIMKATKTPNNHNLAIKLISQKILKKMVSMLSLKFVEIQSGKIQSSFGNKTTLKSLDKQGKNNIKINEIIYKKNT